MWRSLAQAGSVGLVLEPFSYYRPEFGERVSWSLITPCFPLSVAARRGDAVASKSGPGWLAGGRHVPLARPPPVHGRLALTPTPPPHAPRSGAHEATPIALAVRVRVNVEEAAAAWIGWHLGERVAQGHVRD